MKSSENSVLVIGASNRLGREIALYLAKQGYNIIVHYHMDKDGATETLRMIGDKGSLISCDITKKEEIDSLFDNAPPLYSIVNGASLFVDKKFDEVDESRYDADFEIHQKAGFFLTQGLYLYSKNRGINTSIIHLTDAQTAHPSTLRPSYYSAKSSLESMIKVLALSSAPCVRVNGIAPGLIIANNEAEEAYFRKRAEIIPLKRLARADEVSSAVEFLIKNEAITGQIIRVDSGEALL